jgi:hypothetical protein
MDALTGEWCAAHHIARHSLQVQEAPALKGIHQFGLARVELKPFEGGAVRRQLGRQWL